mmetsp:Transcript_32098/g.74671  ORF Transcript_32098/g.74671 Transcript_32098/m.74671 type:complete len:437 (-) Transcript_32098:364-1674(-)
MGGKTVAMKSAGGNERARKSRRRVGGAGEEKAKGSACRRASIEEGRGGRSRRERVGASHAVELEGDDRARERALLAVDRSAAGVENGGKGRRSAGGEGGGRRRRQEQAGPVELYYVVLDIPLYERVALKSHRVNARALRCVVPLEVMWARRGVVVAVRDRLRAVGAALDEGPAGARSVGETTLLRGGQRRPGRCSVGSTGCLGGGGPGGTKSLGCAKRRGSLGCAGGRGRLAVGREKPEALVHVARRLGAGGAPPGTLGAKIGKLGVKRCDDFGLLGVMCGAEVTCWGLQAPPEGPVGKGGKLLGGSRTGAQLGCLGALEGGPLHVREKGEQSEILVGVQRGLQKGKFGRVCVKHGGASAMCEVLLLCVLEVETGHVDVVDELCQLLVVLEGTGPSGELLESGEAIGVSVNPGDLDESVHLIRDMIGPLCSAESRS